MYLLEQHSESFGRQLYWIYIDGNWLLDTILLKHLRKALSKP